MPIAKLHSVFLCLVMALSVGEAAKPVKSGPSGAAKSAANPAGKPVASTVPLSKQPLDYAAVKSYYNDGDFQPAIDMLEEFQKTHSTYAREESLTVYKYLGVMYCADQGTREKGKSYFYKLLKIDPEAKILDMYVSIVVQDIFKSTLDELMGQGGMGHSDRTAIQDQNPNQEKFPMPRPSGERPPKQAALSEKKSHAAYWWIGGLAVAAGVAGGYYVLSSSSGGTAGETDIPIAF